MDRGYEEIMRKKWKWSEESKRKVSQSKKGKLLGCRPHTSDFNYNIVRFLTKIKINKKGCWEWQAGKNKNGYGKFYFNKKTYAAHRFIFEYYHGQICPDLTIDHLCRNTYCVNTNHLEQVSVRINTLRGIGPTAVNARKTHCIHGHEFNKINTRITLEGFRACKTCLSINSRVYRLKQWMEKEIEN